MRPEEYLKIKKEQKLVIENAYNKIREAEEKVVCLPPKNVRRAKPEDIVVDAVLWYHIEDDDDIYWKIVGEVYRPDDDWKAYCADDGCRYGLYEAFVEIK